MTIPTVDIILLICLLIALPLYVTFLGTIIRFRNNRPLNSSFFTICFMLGISDLVTLTNSWVLFKLPMLGWLGADWLVRQAPAAIGKVATMISWWAALGQFHGIFLMAVNRLTSMAFPLRHDLIWSRTSMKIVGFVQFGLPIAVIFPQFWLHFEYQINNQTGQVLSSPMWYEVEWQNGYFAFITYYCMSFNVIMAIIYCYLFFKARKQSVGQTAPSGIYNQLDKKMAIFGLIMFLLMCCVSLYTLLVSTAKDFETQALYFSIYFVFFDVFSWINPILSLALSSDVRRHFVAFLCCREPRRIQTQSNSRLFQPRKKQLVRSGNCDKKNAIELRTL